MTYYELFIKAEYLMTKNKITLGEYYKMIQPLNEEVRNEGEWIRTGRTNVYGGEELMCPFCGDRVIVQNIEYELYCRQCGALLGDRAEGE